MRTVAASFPAAGKYCWLRLKVNMYLRMGIKIPEQSFIIKRGMLSSTTDLKSFVS
jgi:hypothetical protein